MLITRRDLGKLALAAVPGAALAAKDKIVSKINGVMVGVQTYSFRDMTLDEAIAAMQEIGIGYAELYSGHIMPSSTMEAKKWRTMSSVPEMKSIRKKFDDVGIQLYAFNYSFRDDWTDAEITHGFEIAKGLGVKYITASSTLTTAQRLDGPARKYKITVGMHNHSTIKENEFATPDDFAKVLKDTTNIGINLDIGHFYAAGFDPVQFLKDHHSEIVTLHIKDRKKNQGDNKPFGEGDTPIKEVLKVLKDNRYPIPAMIEFEYKGGNPIDEVRRCFDYCKEALG